VRHETVRRVQALIKNGQLPAQSVGRDWLIRLDDLEPFAALPRAPGYGTGRPRKTQE
jgi:excisionase family DNA binding protein